MLNQIVLVGRITQDPKVTELDNGKKICNVTVAIPRSYKNENGEYDTDFVKCTMWSGVAENTSEYCKQGDLIGNKSKRYTDKVQIIIALFINDFKGIFFFIISDMIK